jgi:hypothetical protein
LAKLPGEKTRVLTLHTFHDEFRRYSIVILSASEGSRFFGLRPQNDIEMRVFACSV